MRLPTFFIIGAQKAGTTSLCATIGQHPNVRMSPIKEPRYFLFGGHEPPLVAGPDPDYLRREAVWRPQQYAALFADFGDAAAIGEGSTDYMASPDAARRIASNLPDSRIVAVLRHPVDRIFSSFRYTRNRWREPESSLEKALDDEPRRIAEGWIPSLFYRQIGLYHRNLTVYYDLFPKDRIKIFLYEDWTNAPKDVLHDLCCFLGVEPDCDFPVRRDNVTENRPRNRSVRRVAKRLEAAGLTAPARFVHALNTEPPIVFPPELRPKLTEEFRDDILRLQDLIERDLSHWLEQPPGKP